MKVSQTDIFVQLELWAQLYFSEGTGIQVGHCHVFVLCLTTKKVFQVSTAMPLSCVRRCHLFGLRTIHIAHAEAINKLYYAVIVTGNFSLQTLTFR